MFAKNMWTSQKKEKPKVEVSTERVDAENKLNERMAAIEKRMASVESEITELAYDIEESSTQGKAEVNSINEDIRNLKQSISDFSEKYDRLANLATHTASMAASKNELMDLVKTLSDCLNHIKDKASLPF
jgi:chromosome segregation ATPase